MKIKNDNKKDLFKEIEDGYVVMGKDKEMLYRNVVCFQVKLICSKSNKVLVQKESVVIRGLESERVRLVGNLLKAKQASSVDIIKEVVIDHVKHIFESKLEDPLVESVTHLKSEDEEFLNFT